MAPIVKPVMERLLRHSEVQPSGCIVWTGATGSGDNGYGRIKFNGRMVPTHRVAYEVVKGPIPDGMVIDHLCRNTRCFNPDHLEAVSHRENIMRGVNPSVAVHLTGICQRGHVINEENGKRRKDGRLFCRACWRTAKREGRVRNPDRPAATSAAGHTAPYQHGHGCGNVLESGERCGQFAAVYIRKGRRWYCVTCAAGLAASGGGAA